MRQDPPRTQHARTLADPDPGSRSCHLKVAFRGRFMERFPVLARLIKAYWPSVGSLSSLAFGWVVAVLLFLPVRPGLGADPPRPSKFVFILADDLGWTDLGCGVETSGKVSDGRPLTYVVKGQQVCFNLPVGAAAAYTTLRIAYWDKALTRWVFLTTKLSAPTQRNRFYGIWSFGGAGRTFDDAAGAVAGRHSGGPAVTASMDEMVWLDLSGGAATGSLLEGDARLGALGTVNKNTVGNSFYLNAEPLTFNPVNAGDSDRWQLRLNPAVAYNLTVNMAAGVENVDLTGLSVTRVNLNMAVGSMVVRLPATALTGEIKGAVGETVVYVPRGAVVHIHLDTGLTGVNLPLDFMRNDKEVTSPNQQAAGPAIDLTVGQALGAVSIRYLP